MPLTPNVTSTVIPNGRPAGIAEVVRQDAVQRSQADKLPRVAAGPIELVRGAAPERAQTDKFPRTSWWRRLGTPSGLAALVAVVLLVGCSSSGGDDQTTATLARPSSTAAPPSTTPVATTPVATSPVATTRPTVATTAPAVTPPAITAPATCPSWSEPEVTGRLDHQLRETSGLAASRVTPGVLWAHNDSGNAPVLYALDEAGTLLAELPLPVPLLDWEDMAAGPGPDGTPYLWVADAGDNLTLRPNATVYRLPEPAVAPGATVATLPAEGLERITVAYPDGPHDVEALLVDPITGDAFLVGKETDQDRTVPVYRLPATDLGDGARVEAELIGRVVGRERRGNGPTAGDISADGTLVLVSNGRDGFLWLRDPAQPLAAVFAAQPHAPCSVRPGGGEAVAFSVDGAHLWAVNEGEGAALRRFDRV